MSLGHDASKIFVNKRDSPQAEQGLRSAVTQNQYPDERFSSLLIATGELAGQKSPKIIQLLL